MADIFALHYSCVLFFLKRKTYALAIENDYRYVKRYNFEIQEIRNDK
jgi:hypothetical protein